MTMRFGKVVPLRGAASADETRVTVSLSFVALVPGLIHETSILPHFLLNTARATFAQAGRVEMARVSIVPRACTVRVRQESGVRLDTPEQEHQEKPETKFLKTYGSPCQMARQLAKMGQQDIANRIEEVAQSLEEPPPNES